MDALASDVDGLGGTPEEIVLQGWEGGAFSSAFIQHLVSVSGQVTQLAQEHLAYPVLHFFVAGKRSAAAPLAILALDDAMLLLERGLAPAARPALSATRPVRIGIGSYAATVGAPTSRDASPAVPPELGPLRERGIPVVDDAVFARAVEEEAGRRGDLARSAVAQGWSLSND